MRKQKKKKEPNWADGLKIHHIELSETEFANLQKILSNSPEPSPAFVAAMKRYKSRVKR